MINNFVEFIKDWYPEIFEVKYWACLIIGALCTCLGEWFYKRLDSGYYEWKLIKYLLIFDTILLLGLFFFAAQWQWYFLLILPWGYFPLRYISLQKEYNGTLAPIKSQDIVRYEYLLKLERRKLCSWEVRKFLLPAMNVLFKIGAMKHLDRQLGLLVDHYGASYEWKRLKSYRCSNRQEFSQMLELLKDYEGDKRLSRKEQNRTILNLYHAYHSLNNEEAVKTYIPKIENMLFEHKEYWIDILDDLLCYYERTHNEEGVNKVLEISNHIQAKNFSSYLEYADLQYMHNKRIGDVESNRLLLDKMIRKQAEMSDDDEQSLRFGLRILKLYFENNYAWKEYSIKLFHLAEVYLKYSQEIAFEYMEAVMLIMDNAQTMYKMSLPLDKIQPLFSTIRTYIDKYMPEYDRQITELPDDFVYRKKEMLMHKVTYARLVEFLTKDALTYQKEMCRLVKQIIRLCNDNGEYREALHFIVVLVDEILAFYDNIQMNIDRGVNDSDILQAANEKQLFMEVVKSNMEYVDNVLRENDYNRSLAYYIFYQSYFSYKVGNIENARYALRKFEDTNVPINNFTLRIQALYQQVKEGVKVN